MKNLKLAFVLAVAMLSTTLIKAQNTPIVQAKVGMSSFSDDPKSNNVKGGFAFGIGAGTEIAFSDKFYFQPTLNFNSRRVSYDYTYTVASQALETKVERNFSINTLELPLYFLYKTAEPGASTRFYFGFGPSLGFRVGGKNSFTSSVSGQPDTTWTDAKNSYGEGESDIFNKFVFGLGAQAGLEFSNAFQVGLEWNTDLNNAVNGKATVVNPATKARTGLFALRFALLLGGRDY